MKATVLIASVAGLTLTALTATPSLALKPGFGGLGGFGFHPFHGRGVAHRRASQFPWYGGYGGIAAYDPYSFVAPYGNGDDNGQTVIKLVPPPEPPYSLTCKHSEETKAVPSEDGGVRQIVVTRC